MSNQRKALGEVFELISKKIKHEDKIKILHEHASQPLFYVLRLAYNEIQWALPEGAPPYKPWQGRKGAAPSDIIHECKRLYMFVAGLEPTMRQFHREKLFQDVLESFSPTDVTLLLSIKDRTVEKAYKLPRKVVDAAFPGLLPPPFDLKFGRQQVAPHQSIAGVPPQYQPFGQF